MQRKSYILNPKTKPYIKNGRICAGEGEEVQANQRGAEFREGARPAGVGGYNRNQPPARPRDAVRNPGLHLKNQILSGITQENVIYKALKDPVPFTSVWPMESVLLSQARLSLSYSGALSARSAYRNSINAAHAWPMLLKIHLESWPSVVDPSAMQLFVVSGLLTEVYFTDCLVICRANIRQLSRLL